MSDIASIKSENESLRKIQEKLLQWEKKDKPLAPLTNYQNDIILTLSQIDAEEDQIVSLA
jgi:conserved oligomeric Golgi complex subunit 3